MRLADNPALWHAATNHESLLLVYFFEDHGPWAMGGAQRWWLHHSLLRLKQQLAKHHHQLLLLQGDPTKILPALIKQYGINAVYWNRCYEPHAIARDTAIKAILKKQEIQANSFNASLLQEPWQVLNQAGQYFKVFTPYWRAACRQLTHRALHPIPSFQSVVPHNTESLEDWHLLPVRPNWAKGFSNFWQVGEEAAQDKLQHFIDQQLMQYDVARDRPDQPGTSLLSPHLHFGEISPWQIWHAIQTVQYDKRVPEAATQRFLAELGWREFSYHLLYHVPQLPEQNFREEFNRFAWVDDNEALVQWQKGLTGYPIVDAGMRQLWHTGYMHNRVRMIVASFLTKDLLIDWQHGARWFWDTLLDADLASNSASWQWVAGCGADAAPYFRIFNPVLQGEKFDPKGEYVSQWVPELKALPPSVIHQPWQASPQELATASVVLGENYPKPMVDHQKARQEALMRYQQLR